MSQGMARYLAEGDAQAERHVLTLAFLNLAALAVTAGLATWLLSGLPHAPDAPERLARLGLASAMVASALVNALLWRGLLKRAPWARSLQLVSAVLSLPLVPLGTLWGLYAMWALTRPHSRRIFAADYLAWRAQRRMPDASPYVGALVAATTLGTALVVGGLVRGRTVWLERRVEAAAKRAAERQAQVGRAFEDLREAGGLDLVPGSLPGSAAALAPVPARAVPPAVPPAGE